MLHDAASSVTAAVGASVVLDVVKTTVACDFAVPIAVAYFAVQIDVAENIFAPVLFRPPLASRPPTRLLIEHAQFCPRSVAKLGRAHHFSSSSSSTAANDRQN